MTIYADKFYTYEDQVLTALRNLRQRQVEASFEDSAPQVYTCNFLQPISFSYFYFGLKEYNVNMKNYLQVYVLHEAKLEI